MKILSLKRQNLKKTVYDDHEELSSAFQSTVEHLTNSDNDFDEEGKMEIDIEENGKNVLSDIAEWASKYLITHSYSPKGIIGDFEKPWTSKLTKGSKEFT